MKYPKIRTYLLVTKYSGKVSIGSSINRAIEILDPTGVIFKIIELCDGKNEVNQIYEKVKLEFKEIERKDVDKLIELLIEKKYILEEHENYNNFFKDLSKERHKRNINFLSNFSPEGHEKYEYIEKIQNQKVLLLGLGGVGSVVLYNLAALGVKNITGVDFDKVDTTNLNRQILYRESDVGDNKVDAAERTVNEFNSSIKFSTVNKKIESEEDLDKIISDSGCTFIICAADRPSVLINDWVNSVSIRRGIPWIYGGNSETVSFYRLVNPSQTSCFECSEYNFKDNGLQEALKKLDYIRKFQPAPENNCIAASSSILGSMMIFDFIKFLTDMTSLKSNSSIVKFDYLTMELHETKIPKNPQCACSILTEGGEKNENRNY
ncbi:ThiF family adenylyltransferase [Paenibacillus sp. 7516]|uniref:ThiF family adenylyltransferase n=1 Tax=Paenibacillus sp. 7516 TaxID=2022549 RepID=UPI000BA5E5EA|nr:ThiF family adenylyltransferase [Paenibacillus sp. 7516]PAF28162.1 hypothetical protein CHI14_29195 [Paenibacillus sp. 7516]